MLHGIVSLYTSVYTFYGRDHFKRRVAFSVRKTGQGTRSGLFSRFTHRFHYAVVKVHCSLLWILVKGARVFGPENFPRVLNSRKFCVSTFVRQGLYFVPPFLFSVSFFFFLFCFFLATIKPYNCQPLVRAVLRRFNRYHQVYQRTILINLRHRRNCSLVICNICKASKIYFLLFNVFHVCPTYVSF